MISCRFLAGLLKHLKDVPSFGISADNFLFFIRFSTRTWLLTFGNKNTDVFFGFWDGHLLHRTSPGSIRCTIYAFPEEQKSIVRASALRIRLRNSATCSNRTQLDQAHKKDDNGRILVHLFLSPWFHTVRIVEVLVSEKVTLCLMYTECFLINTFCFLINFLQKWTTETIFLSKIQNQVCMRIFSIKFLGKVPTNKPVNTSQI